MALTDFVTEWLVDTRTQRSQAAGRLDGFLEQLLVLLRKRAALPQDSKARADALEDVRAHLETLPTADVAYLSSNARQREAEALRRLQEGVSAARDRIRTEASVPDVAEVEGLRAQLRSALQRSQAPLALLKLGLYAVPVAVAYLIGVYFRMHQGVYFERQSWLWPDGGYEEARAGSFAPTPDYVARYFEEFSRFYFDRTPNKFQQLVNRPNEKAEGLHPAMQSKFVLTNPSRAPPLVVSTLAVSAVHKPAPFSWSKVNVTPDVTMEVEGKKLRLEDSGIGPALDVEYELRSTKFLIRTGKQDSLYESNVLLNLENPIPPVFAADVAFDGTLRRPLYFVRAPRDPRARALCPGLWYETLTTLDQLRSVADVEYKSKLTLTTQFASLRGEALRKTLEADLPPQLAYVQLDQNLVDAPPCVTTLKSTAGLAGDKRMSSALPKLFDAIFPGAAAMPKGVDLLITNLSLDLAKQQRATIDPDQIVNPAGAVIVYVDFANPGNGSYDVSLKVNDQEIRAFAMQSLAPESYHFNPANLAAEKQRFGWAPLAK